MGENEPIYTPILQIHPSDNVVVATRPIAAQEPITLSGVSVTIPNPLPLGAKLAVRSIAQGEKVIKYGEPIGTATCPIPIGAHVHLHNLRSDYLPTGKIVPS